MECTRSIPRARCRKRESSRCSKRPQAHDPTAHYRFNSNEKTVRHYIGQGVKIVGDADLAFRQPTNTSR
jgi:hypothetical protein